MKTVAGSNCFKRCSETRITPLVLAFWAAATANRTAIEIDSLFASFIFTSAIERRISAPLGSNPAAVSNRFELGSTILQQHYGAARREPLDCDHPIESIPPQQAGIFLKSSN